MSKIKILSDHLTNKIAAGEVVTRPSSLIKELVENSIDSGASEIIVVIRNGGKLLCEVVDNGEGMTKDDLLLAFERYATSKIKTIDDLIKIQTLGFRGEALASVAAVSRVNAISTLKGSDIGYELSIEGGIFKQIIPHSPKSGTTISVKNLFYNIPARKKFLKSKDVEFRHIVEVIRKFSMIYPRIKFVLIHNDREVFSLRSERLKDRIGNLFSKEYPPNLIPFNYKEGALEVNGYIGNLNLVRARRGEQFFYVNNRFITDRLMNHAITSGYSSLLSRGEFPFYCLHISLPPELIDVNVHPQKMEVKFSDQNKVYNFLKHSTTKSLAEITSNTPDLASFSPEHYYSPTPVPTSINTERSSQASTVQINPVSQKMNIPSYSKVEPPKKQEEIPIHYSQKIDDKKWIERAQRFQERSEDQANSENFSLDVKVYQIHNKYLISQIKSGMVIIDQHVAHERILFEEALRSMEKEPLSAQQLLFPQIVELSITDFSTLLEILPYLEKLGFQVKEFGKNTVAIEAVPAGMKWGDEGKVIKDILDYYMEYGKKDTDIKTKIAASYSCKAAIKAGDKLSEQEMHNLVDRLFATQNPYFCPHGRPIVVNLTLDELDKRFERK